MMKIQPIRAKHRDSSTNESGEDWLGSVPEQASQERLDWIVEGDNYFADN